MNRIRIGSNTSVGDRAVVHVAREGLRQDGFVTNIGDNVIIGALGVSVLPLRCGADSNRERRYSAWMHD